METLYGRYVTRQYLDNDINQSNGIMCMVHPALSLRQATMLMDIRILIIADDYHYKDPPKITGRPRAEVSHHGFLGVDQDCDPNSSTMNK